MVGLLNQENIISRLINILLTITIICCGLLACQQAFAIQASVSLKPTTVNINQTVTLRLSLDAENPEVPDFSVLKESFRILKKRNSSSISQSGNTIVLKKEWILTLLPQKEGNLTIPAIQIGNESTTPISLQVNDPKKPNKSASVIYSDIDKSKSNHSSIEWSSSSKADGFSKTADNPNPTDNLASANNTNPDNDSSIIKDPSIADDASSKQISHQDIIIKVSVSPDKAYVQGQVLLTQKIFHAIPLKSANLDTPVINNNAANIIPLSEMKPYYWKLNGKRYHVIERNYAVFPKHSGSLEIEPINFSGEAKIQSVNKGGPFGLQTKTTLQKVTASAEGIHINIQPQEESYSANHWLPAKNITVNRKWSKPLSDLKKGDTIILQTTIIADGLRSEQLPETYLKLPDSIKTYTQPIDLSNTITQSGITGVSRQKVSLVLSQTGEVKIPELQLPWWNVTTGREEIAKLPMEILLIEKIQTTNIPENKKMVTNPPRKETDANLSQASTLTSVLTHASTEEKSASVNWLYLLILPALFIFDFLLFRRKRSNKIIHTPNQEIDQQQLLNNLKKACLANNPQKVEQQILHWAEHVANIHPATLEGIIHANNGYLRLEIEQLSQSLYSRSQLNWKGVSLWDAIKKYPYPTGTTVGRKTNTLQNIFPS